MLKTTLSAFIFGIAASQDLFLTEEQRRLQPESTGTHVEGLVEEPSVYDAQGGFLDSPSG